MKNSLLSRVSFILILIPIMSGILTSCEKSKIEVDQKYDIRVYPNPFLDSFSIVMMDGETTQVSISVFKNNNESIYEETITLYPKNSIVIDAISGEPQGTYLLTIEFEDRVEIIKLIKT